MLLIFGFAGAAYFLYKSGLGVSSLSSLAAGAAAANPNNVNSNMAAIETIHPKLKSKVLQLIELAKADGHALTVTSGLRSHAEQAKLYAKGRTAAGARVTNAKPGQSWHNFGLAADLAFLDSGKVSFDEKKFNYALIGKWARAVGLEWGGNFKTFKDKPHVQLLNGLTLKTAAAYYKAGGLNTVWAHV